MLFLFRAAYRRLNSFLSPALFALLLAAAPAVPSDTSAQTGGTAQQARIQQIQQMLASEGFDPGPADGLIGGRTVQAIIAFQGREGLPQTGRPDAAVLERLKLRRLANTTTAAGNATAPPPAEAAATPANAVSDRVSTLAPSTWELVDGSGSRQSISLLAAGKVGDTAIPKFWKWQLGEDALVIEFDNGAGGWVKRVGRFVSSDRIVGRAESSRGQIWEWTGHRQKTQ